MTTTHPAVWLPATTTRERRAPRRPPEVVALVAIDIAAIALCLVGVVRPPSPQTPVVLDAVAALVGIVLLVTVLAHGVRVPRAVIAVNITAYVAMTAAIVARAGTGEGAASTAMSFLFVGLYVAAFFPRRTSRACTAALIVVSGASLLSSAPVGNPLTTWLPLALAIAVSSEMLSMLLGHMRRLTVTDGLTGALNRSGFEDQVVRERAVSRRTQESLSLVVIDINDFKSVNDRHGHAIGDALLAGVTAEWRAKLRVGDVIGRRGGDEFALLLPQTNEVQARTMAARLQTSSAYDWSYGVAALGIDEDIDDCLARADEEMYRQKRRPSEAVSPAE